MREYGPGRLQTDGDLRWKDEFVLYYEVERGGMVSFEDLYMHVFHWFVKEGFTHWADDGKEIEDFYLHRIKPDGVQENLIWWRAKRVINPFITYACKMDWQNFGAKSTEILYKEKKIKTHKIGIVIRVWWWVQIDPENKWEKSFLGRLWHGKFPKWFYKYILNTDMEYHQEKVRTIARRQENELKQFFEMTTNIPMPRSWFPESGYKQDRVKTTGEEFADRPRKPDQQI